MFLFYKLVFETYVVTRTAEIAFKTHILLCVFLNDNLLPYSNEVDQDISRVYLTFIQFTVAFCLKLN